MDLGSVTGIAVARGDTIIAGQTEFKRRTAVNFGLRVLCAEQTGQNKVDEQRIGRCAADHPADSA